MSFFRDPFTGPIFFFSYVTHPFLIKMKADQGQHTDFELVRCSFGIRNHVSPKLPNFLSHRYDEGVGHAHSLEMADGQDAHVLGGIYSLVAVHVRVFYSLTDPQGELNFVVSRMFLPETWLGKRCSTLSAQLAKGPFFSISVCTPFMNWGWSFLPSAPAVLPHHRVL